MTTPRDGPGARPSMAERASDPRNPFTGFRHFKDRAEQWPGAMVKRGVVVVTDADGATTNVMCESVRIPGSATNSGKTEHVAFQEHVDRWGQASQAVISPEAFEWFVRARAGANKRNRMAKARRTRGPAGDPRS